MRRGLWFLSGLILGAVGMLISIKYYVVRAESGVYLIPKATAEVSMPYVDIRHFSLAEWNERRDLALAIVQAGKGELMEDAAVGGLRQAMEGVVQSLRGPESEMR